jgi:hypothetical protein
VRARHRNLPDHVGRVRPRCDDECSMVADPRLRDDDLAGSERG